MYCTRSSIRGCVMNSVQPYTKELTDDSVFLHSTSSRMAGVVRLVTGDRSGAIGIGIVAFIVLAVIVGPFFSPYSAIAIDHATMGYPQAPSAAHWLGTDMLG